MIFSIVLAVIVALIGALAILGAKQRKGMLAQMMGKLLLGGNADVAKDPIARTTLSSLGVEFLLIAGFVGIPFTLFWVDVISIGALFAHVIRYRYLHMKSRLNLESPEVRLTVIKGLQVRETTILRDLEQQQDPSSPERRLERVYIGRGLAQLRKEMQVECGG